MEREVGFGHKKLQFFEPNSSPLGLENTFNLIKYPFLGFKKPQFGAKLVVKIPRLGTRGQGKKCSNARTPQESPPPLHCKIYDEYSQHFQTYKKVFQKRHQFLMSFMLLQILKIITDEK